MRNNNRTIEQIIDQNIELKARLDNLAKHKQSLSTTYSSQRTGHVLSPHQFLPKDPQYDYVQPKTKYNSINLLMTARQQKLQKEYERMMQVCSFKPKINEKTHTIVNAGFYVPPADRPLPPKKPQATLPTDSSLDDKRTSSSLRGGNHESNFQTLTTSGLRKIDEEFYQKKVQWKREAEEKRIQERLDKQLKSHQPIQAMPQVNKRRNEELLKTPKDFMSRVEMNLHHSKEKKQRLDQKYNSFSFRPATNKNIPVKSIVLETIRSKNRNGAVPKTQRAL
jgi:hypothetical protein